MKSAVMLRSTVAAIALLSTPAVANDQPAAAAPGSDENRVRDDDILVVGSVFQNRKDIESRRGSAHVMDSISQDDIGTLPDTTIADTLRRITGVTTMNDDEIGQYISVRGVNSDLIAVTVDGLTLATMGTNGGGRRRTNLQVIPSWAVQQLQAYKSFTPDMESGAMGGLVNLVPVSAYDYRNRRFIAQIGTNYSSYLDVPDVNSSGGKKKSPFGSNASFTYADKFGGNEQFGIVLAGVWSQRQKDQSNDTRSELLYFNDQ